MLVFFPIKSSQHTLTTAIHQLFAAEINIMLVPSNIYPSNQLFSHWCIILLKWEPCFMLYVLGARTMNHRTSLELFLFDSRVEGTHKIL